MTKFKYIVLHTIFILFLNCSGSGGCPFFNKANEAPYLPVNENQKIAEQANDYKEVASTQKLIEKIPDVLNKEIHLKKIVQDTIKEKTDGTPDIKNTIPKATYVQFTNAPESIDPISPKYPEYELDNGIQGVVYIQFRINTLGNVAESYVARSSGNRNLDNAALNAVLSSKWQPAKNQGKLVSVWQTLPFEFKLTN